MVPWILLLLPVPALATVDKTHGVPLNLISKYVPLNGGASPTWKCLDGTREIAWSAVNDDFCDCPDGSDEPGTGACPDTFFVCRNEDHIPGRIPSSRVNDGLCEPECCDGSDERSGVCGNTCKEVGAAYRMEQEAERKLRKTGSKIRSSYITFAQKEKKRLEETIATSQKEINSRQQEVDRLRDVVDRTESLSAAALEEKKQSPLYQTLVKHHQALKSLQKEHKKHVEREKALGDILDALRSKYNPNYQDMAVLEAVRGWEYYAGLPHINDVRKNEEGSDEEDAGETAAEEEEELEEGMWSKEQLEKDLDSLLNSNYESLLLEHENHIGAPTTESVLFNLSAYLPDPLVPQYEQFRDGLLSWLETFGIIKGTHPSGATAGRFALIHQRRFARHQQTPYPDTSHAKQVLNEAEQVLKFAQQEKSKAEEDVNRLFDPKWFGVEGEWKKLDGTCLEKDTGEYIYEVCLFGEAKQKPKNSGSTFSLGHFTSWNNAEGIEIGSPEYYSKQYYTRGAKCWNGPQRSVVLVWTCGTENAIHSIQELEKCEYQLTGTSPALCLPPDAPAAVGKREEL